DHAVVRMGMRGLLCPSRGFEVVAEATNGLQALSHFLVHRPDIVLMDLRMPRMNGIEAVAQIRSASPTARILMLTTFDGQEDAHRALEAGASGYLLKSMDGPEMLGAIRAVHAGETFLPPQIEEKLNQRIPGDELSPREHEVLELMSRNHSSEEIAMKLEISPNTLKTHIRQILAKLKARDRTEAVCRAAERGVIWLTGNDGRSPDSIA
ncbi:MAG: response regulator transcription factor, partial [Verrucomicrobiota bacterium]